MPIRPENRARYPRDWPAIRDRILRRAQMRCEHPGCCARQYDVGYWRQQAGEWCWFEFGRNWPTYAAAKQFGAEKHFDRYGDGPTPPGEPRIVVIVLTIAHLDHTPENCDPANLRALCQRHHLALDAEHHKETAYATRRAAALTADLFGVEGEPAR